MIYKRELGYPNLVGLMQRLDVLPHSAAPNHLARTVLKQAVLNLGTFGKPIVGSVTPAAEDDRFAYLNPRLHWESIDKYQEKTRIMPMSRDPKTPSYRELPDPIFDSFVQVSPQEIGEYKNIYNYALKYAVRTAVTIGTAITECREIPDSYDEMQVSRSVLQEMPVGTLEVRPASPDWRIGMAWDGEIINVDDIDFSEGGLGNGPKPFGNMNAIYEAVVGAGDAARPLIAK